MRRELGCEAFGINWFELPPGAPGLEHNETDSGQEEVNVVIAGSGVWRIEGEEVPVRAGTFLRFDPETTRQPVAGPDGMTFIGVGCRRAGATRPAGRSDAQRRLRPQVTEVRTCRGRRRKTMPGRRSRARRSPAPGTGIDPS